MPALRKPRYRGRYFANVGIVQSQGMPEPAVNLITFDILTLENAIWVRDWLNKAITWMEYKQGKV